MASPRFSTLKFWEKEADSEQPDGFADTVIVILRQGVANVSFDAGGGHSNHRGKRNNAFGSGMGRTQKCIQAEAPSHHSKTGFLSALPIGPKLWGIVRRPVLYEGPKCLDITLVVRECIGTDQCINRTKTARFPDEF